MSGWSTDFSLHVVSLFSFLSWFFYIVRVCFVVDVILLYQRIFLPLLIHFGSASLACFNAIRSLVWFILVSCLVPSSL